MRTIGAFEAKTHLSELLEKASQGEETLITKRGVPIAKIIPFEKEKPSQQKDLVSEFKVLRRSLKLQPLSWQELRDQGRR